MEPLNNQKDQFQKLFIIGLIVSVISFVISYLLIPESDKLILLDLEKKYFFVLGILLAAALFYFIIKYNEKIVHVIAKYLFFLIFLYSIGVNFIPIKEYSDSFVRLYEKLVTYQLFLVPFGSVFGIFVLLLNKEKIKDYVNIIFIEDKSASLNIKYKIIKLFDKKELAYTIAFIFIIILSIFTNFYKLGNFDFFSDEVQTIEGAAGYYHSGEYKQWDFTKQKMTDNKYNRAKPHQFIIAMSYKIFDISEWSSRLPSALSGVLLIVLLYLIGRYWFDDKLAIIFVIFSAAFYFEYLFLQRWSRMYAMLIPLFLINTYLIYKFLSEKNSIKKIQFKTDSFADKYLNFNYIYLPFILVLIYLNYRIHINSVIIFPIIFLYVIIVYFITKEKKYLTIIILGFVVLISQIIHPYKINYKFFTFFEINNFKYYLKAFIGFPFSSYTNLIFIIPIISTLFYIKKNKYQKVIILFSLVLLTGLILFSFVLNRYEAFKYMSFLSPLVLIFIIFSYVLFFKASYSKILSIFLGFMIVASVLMRFDNTYEKLYVRNFASDAYPSKAYKTIKDNYKAGEIIGRHWGPRYYFKGIDTSVRFFSIGHYKGKPLSEILDTIKNYKSGWITWLYRNTPIIDDDFIQYADICMKKYHGYGIDDSGVEVYHFVDSLLIDTLEFNQKANFPTANLNSKEPLSLAFWVKITPNSKGAPFYFKAPDKRVLDIAFKGKQKKSICINYFENRDSIQSKNLLDTNWHHITVLHNYINKKYNVQIFIDGSKVNEKTIKKDITQYIKFTVNPKFQGITDDVRIYDFILNNAQINTIIADKNTSHKEELTVRDDETFKALFYWYRKK